MGHPVDRLSMDAEAIVVDDDLEQAVEEWDNVAEVVPQFRVGNPG